MDKKVYSDTVQGVNHVINNSKYRVIVVLIACSS